MARMKKFLFYLIIFVAFFIYTSLMTKLALKNIYQKNVNVDILTESPVITVHNCETGNNSGLISGIVRNDTENYIEKAILCVDLYDENGLVKTLTEELKYFHNNESIKFDLSFNEKNINSIKLSVEY